MKAILKRDVLVMFVLVAALILAVAACAVPEPVVRTPKDEVARLPLIDMHSHSSGIPRRTAQEFVATMDAVGIGRMVLFVGRPDNLNEFQKHAERLVLFYTGAIANDAVRANIKTGDPKAVEEFLAGYERALQSGLYYGLGEIYAYHSDRPTQIAPDSPAIRGLLELATKYEVPITIHCDANGRVEMERALKAHPNATVIWAHTGSFLPPEALMDLLRRYPNFYFDLAIKNKRLRTDGYPILFGTSLREEWRQLFESFPDRFLVGFDFPGVGPTHGTPLSMARESTEFIRTILSQLIPDTARKVAYENAEAMLAKRKIEKRTSLKM
jgi:hypothetical protein